VSLTAIHSPVSSGTPPSTQNVSLEPDEVADDNCDLISDIRHLRLLHHFTTVTAATFAHEPKAEDVFSSYLVKLGFESPFLLHAILSLAAIHLSKSELNRRVEHRLQAERHHQAALAQFRTEVTAVNESNFHAVVSFNALLFPYLWAVSTSSADPDHAFDSIISNMILTRKLRPIITAPGFFEAMKDSELGRVIPEDVYAVDWHTAEPSTETELSQLRKFSGIMSHIYPPDIIDAYGQAIRLLELLFEAAAKSPGLPSDSMLKCWVYFVTPRFVELLAEKQPGALIIFCHYGVALGRSRHYWFLDTTDELILTIADTFVPTEWKSWLDWPKEQIRAGISPRSWAT